MKPRIIVSTTTLFVSSTLFGVTSSTPDSEYESGAPARRPSPPQTAEGVTLPNLISEIVEKDEVTAEDYGKVASGTMQVAMQLMQQGQEMPDGPVEDALDAVAAGRELDPIAADWDSLEQRLLDLLNPPHQEQQPQQQEGDNSDEQQEQQDGEQQEGSSGSSEEGSENSEESDAQSQGDESQQSDEGQQGEDAEQQQEGENGESQNQDGGEERGEQGEGDESTQATNTQDGAQMGELDQPEEQQQVELDGEESAQQPSQEEMQTLGGKQAVGEPVNAETAALKQMLEQLRQQDQPGKLYQILQEAQTGGKKKQQPNAKDW
ncbi:hypothetical protein QEH56_14200 [Pelagicoccus enzymogenes]|uniref:hypothetical protein n=1 Tax=Pelagicoccus enzymogenes TaxID=2773457 RepID=UPI00280CE979|nr:hypothetical protein [Pelagicoccus enzymogenes]MDQ8199318.1 hypothetical protein [Pelagicoccus enzymogenes]